MRIIRTAVTLAAAMLMPAHADDAGNDYVPAETIQRTWILDGDSELRVLDEHTLAIDVTDKMALWQPVVYEGPVTIEFECKMTEPYTKCLVFVHGHGSDDSPIWTWSRDGVYDGYNAGRMEVYTVGFNRGPHVSDRANDQLCNVRRIGGPSFAKYTRQAFLDAQDEGRLGAFRGEWRDRSLLGAALEPHSGLDRFLHYRIVVDPPRIELWVEGERFAAFVDHRPDPLTKGSVGFRCMKLPRTIVIRNVSIQGRAVQARDSQAD